MLIMGLGGWELYSLRKDRKKPPEEREK